MTRNTLSSDQPSLLADAFSSFEGLQTFLKRRDSGQWLRMSRYHSIDQVDLLDSMESSSSRRFAFELAEKSNFLVLFVPHTEPGPISRAVDTLRHLGLITPAIYRVGDATYIYLFLESDINRDTAIEELNEWISHSVCGPDSAKFIDGPIPFPFAQSVSRLNSEGEEILSLSQVSVQAAFALFLQDRKTTVDIEQALDVIRNLVSPMSPSVVHESDPPEAETSQPLSISMFTEGEHSDLFSSYSNELDQLARVLAHMSGHRSSPHRQKKLRILSPSKVPRQLPLPLLEVRSWASNEANKIVRAPP